MFSNTSPLCITLTDFGNLLFEGDRDERLMYIVFPGTMMK